MFQLRLHIPIAEAVNDARAVIRENHHTGRPLDKLVHVFHHGAHQGKQLGRNAGRRGRGYLLRINIAIGVKAKRGAAFPRLDKRRRKRLILHHAMQYKLFPDRPVVTHTNLHAIDLSRNNDPGSGTIIPGSISRQILSSSLPYKRPTHEIEYHRDLFFLVLRTAKRGGFRKTCTSTVSYTKEDLQHVTTAHLAR